MSKKITLNLPDNIIEELEELKEYFHCTTMSGTTSLSIDTLYWIMKKQKENYIVKAERQDKCKVIIQEIPNPMYR
jgi:hypothetical protein